MWYLLSLPLSFPSISSFSPLFFFPSPSTSSIESRYCLLPFCLFALLLSLERLFPPTQNFACSSGRPSPLLCSPLYSPISFPFPCLYNSSAGELASCTCLRQSPCPWRACVLFRAAISATPDTSRTPFYFPRPSLHCCCMTPVCVPTSFCPFLQTSPPPVPPLHDPAFPASSFRPAWTVGRKFWHHTPSKV